MSPGAHEHSDATTAARRTADPFVVSVGLEEAVDGATVVHALTLPGCTAWGANRDEALAAFPTELAGWLNATAGFGAPAPSPEQELEITVDEWVETDADVIARETTACFDWDLTPLTDTALEELLHRLGDLRGLLLTRIRRARDADLEVARSGRWNARELVDELARAQWWTLSRLGASPLAEVPQRAVARLDTAMALVVQQFVEMPAGSRDRVVELDGELWTPRKVLRRLLWLEWSLGRAILSTLRQAS